MKKGVKKKTFWMQRNLAKGWYLCRHKHRDGISKYLLLWKHLSLKREFNNQFNNSIIPIKLPRRQIKKVAIGKQSLRDT